MRRNSWYISLLILLLTLGLLNYVGGFLHFRIDHTADQRYTLSPYTAGLLDSLQEPVYIKSYLGGDIPLEFNRLRQNLEELLEEYVVGSHYQIQTMQEDPNVGEDERVRREYQASLLRKGIRPVNVQERRADGAYTERLVFPALSLSYRARTVSVNIYHEEAVRATPENVDISIAGLEYAITSALYDLLQQEKPKVAFLHGHGELDAEQTADWESSLARHTAVSHLPMPTTVGALDPFAFVVEANPEQPFTEGEKLVLDQYLMRGGRLLLMCNPVRTSVDSLQKMGLTLAFPRDLNLGDMLFRYGLRIRDAIVQDLQCALVPVNTALAGQPARFTPMPWIYYPLLTPSQRSLVSRNVVPVYSRFPSFIEPTGGQDGLEKEVFLSSSSHSRAVSVPAMINLSEIQQNPMNLPMPSRYLPVGVSVSGKLTSVFKHRPLKSISGGQSFAFREQSDGTRLAVISDGRIAANEVVRKGGTARPLPLGFDKYTQQTFGNKELLQNLSLYLLGQDELLALRGRKITARVLDQKRVHEGRTLWQVVNTVLPSLLLLLMGGAWALVRRWRYR